MKTLRRFIAVEFQPVGYDQFGRPYSREPRKWTRVLTPGTNLQNMGLPLEIEAVGLSEFPTSLNLEVVIDDSRIEDELKKINYAFPGVVLSKVFIPIPTTPQLKRIKLATILQFQAQAA